MSELAPPDGTVERWAWDYITSTDAAYKLSPPEVPTELHPPRAWDPPCAPGRPAAWTVTPRAPKAPSADALRAPEARCRLAHTFMHHELQATELFGWALLALPDAPAGLRRGWAGLLRDELRHMAMYGEYLDRHGSFFGQQPVRDWFWSRVPAARSAASFCAVMGMGLEAGNLDHTARYARWLRDANDPAGARIQEVVGEEEVSHVRLGLRWFEDLTGGGGYEAWRRALPPPLSPWMMKGRALAVEARRRAGMSEEFLDELAREAFTPLRAAPP